MSNTFGSLASMRVSDALTSDVVTLSAFATMEEAAKVFSQYDIRGAPVVDEFGRCIGVLTTSDFAKVEDEKRFTDANSMFADEYALVSGASGLPFHIEHAATDSVRLHMSHATQTIAGSRSLIDAARWMRGQHIHRLVVVDEHCHPIGILSTHDILDALVQSADMRDRGVG